MDTSLEIKVTIEINDQVFRMGSIISNVKDPMEATEYLLGTIERKIRPEVEKYLERRNGDHKANRLNIIAECVDELKRYEGREKPIHPTCYRLLRNIAKYLIEQQE